ncbi:MAG: response regulator, partial [Candidatus Sumerlaeota bacterium]|nr:response regulator [Candidatus Sumerlaeota bacterium]
VDSSGQWLELRAACSAVDAHGRSFAPGEWKGKRFRVGEGVMGRAAQTGEAIRVEDAANDSVFLQDPNCHVSVRSLLSFPLCIEGQTIGVLNLSHSQPHFFQVEEEATLRLVADRIARLVRSHLLHRRLRESEEHYRLVFETSGAGLFIYRFIEPDRLALLSANPEAERLTGVCASRQPDAAFEETWRGLSAGNWKETALEVMRAGETRILEDQPYESAAFKGYLRLRLFRITSDQLGVTFENVTERKQAEEEKAALMGQLQQAQKMDALGRLAGGIAHDFNNILLAILGYAELAEEDLAPDSRARSDLGEVVRAATRATELVKQILTFSRPGKRMRRALLIRPAIKEALKLMRSTLPTTIEIHESILADGVYVLADPTEIHQVLVNLCVNAFHAMRERGGTLTVGLEEVTPDASLCARIPDLAAETPYARLSVGDTGCGMDPATLERVFEPYFTTKKPGEGTGLGLSMAHGIVKSCEGAIAARSELGRGTTFDVYLPVCRAVDGDLVQEIHEDWDTFRGGERVLFVDDEETIVRLMASSLSRFGYQVAPFTDAEQALDAFRARPEEFDAVITDQTMPRLTGLKLTRRVLGIRPGLPVILCTGYSENVDRPAALAAGARDFFMKPVAPLTLAKALRQALDEAREEP